MRRIFSIIFALTLALSLCAPVAALAAFQTPHPDFQAGTAVDSEKLDANFSALESVVGTNEFEEQNYVTDDASLTENINSLDKELHRLATTSVLCPLYDVRMADDAGTNVTLGSTTDRKQAAVRLSASATQGILGSARLPDATRDYQLVIEIQQATAETSKAIVLKVEILAVDTGEDSAANAADVSSTQTITVRADALKQIIINVNFKILSAALPADNQFVRVGIFRVGGDGADTHGGATDLIEAYFVAQ